MKRDYAYNKIKHAHCGHVVADISDSVTSSTCVGEDQE